MGLGDFLEGVQSVIETGITTLPQIIAAGQGQNVNVPGIPSLSPGTIANFSNLTKGVDLLGSGMATAAGSCPTFRPTKARVRAMPEIRAVNPSTGKIESWVHRGSPLIWSGDRACAKRYAKQAGFTLRRRASGGTTRRRTTRRR